MAVLIGVKAKSNNDIDDEGTLRCQSLFVATTNDVKNEEKMNWMNQKQELKTKHENEEWIDINLDDFE